jgi:hypothetical protein
LPTNAGLPRIEDAPSCISHRESQAAGHIGGFPCEFTLTKPVLFVPSKSSRPSFSLVLAPDHSSRDRKGPVRRIADNAESAISASLRNIASCRKMRGRRRVACCQCAARSIHLRSCLMVNQFSGSSLLEAWQANSSGRQDRVLTSEARPNIPIGPRSSPLLRPAHHPEAHGP